MKIITKLLAVVLAFSGFMQTANAQEGFRCGADQQRHELISQYPEVLEEEAKLDAFTKQFAANYSANQREFDYVIPIVFHIIHRGGTENITDAQVLDQLRILNEDFQKLNADTSLVIPEFKNLIGNAKVEFRLARKNPDGVATNGIMHYYSSQTFQGQSNFSKMNPWPRDKYLNVWVVDKMQGGVAGYAYYPSSVDVQPISPAMDGIIILNDYIGSIGTANASRSRALTHEVGHWLNLKHVWGDNNDPGDACGDDDVNDTPETKGWDYCPSAVNSRVCDTTVKENYQNFMEYSYCSRMFTAAQVVRMHAALNSPIAGRNNLWSPENLLATGTDTYVEPYSAPIADFSVNRFYACVGEPVLFRDNSYNAEITERLWTFSNADSVNATNATVNVRFYLPGWNNVTLTVKGNDGESTTTKALVYVFPEAPYALEVPVYEDFETDFQYNDNWASINIDRDQPEFHLVKNVGHSGNQSVLLDNYYSRYEHNIDELISPKYNLSTLTNTNAKISFYYSLASWNPNFSQWFYDSLVVFASKNCGNTWLRLDDYGTNAVVNAGYVPTYFIPTKDQSFWRKVSITLPGPSSANNLRVNGVNFKITVYGAHNTNNFYFDDWNVGMADEPNYNTVGIGDVEFTSNLAVFPNPFDNQVTVMGLEDKKHNISIVDIAGRQVYYGEGLMPAEGMINIDLANVATSGIYFVRVSDGKLSGNFKLVKN